MTAHPSPDNVNMDALLDEDELVPVVLLVPNGTQGPNGSPGFIPRQFAATTTTLLKVQQTLENGALLDISAAQRRARDIIATHLADTELADQIAAHLVEDGVIS